jgi:BASS family bile acid:Na+ symporter
MTLNVVIQTFLGLGLGSIMFGIGLTLSGRDFVRVFEMPKAILAGLGAQLVGLPVAAVLTLGLIQLPPEYAMGFLIVATSPGGPTSNLFSFLARADVALSVSLTAISSVVTLLTIPLILSMGARALLGETSDVRLPATTIVLQLLLLVLLPMSIGVLVRGLRPSWAERLRRPMAALSVIILVAIISYVLNQEFARLTGYLGELLPSLLLFALIAIGLGFATALVMRVSWRQTKTISIEVGIQNGAQAMVIATSALGFNNPQMGVPAALYSICMYVFVALLLVAFRVIEASRH